MGLKLGGYAPFCGEGWVPIYHKVAWAEAYLCAKYHLDPSSRLATPLLSSEHSSWLSCCLLEGRGDRQGNSSTL